MPLQLLTFFCQGYRKREAGRGEGGLSDTLTLFQFGLTEYAHCPLHYYWPPIFVYFHTALLLFTAFFCLVLTTKKLLNYGVVGTWGTGGLHILVAIEAKNSPLKEKGLFTFPPHPQEETEDWSDSVSTYTQIFSSKKTGFSPVKNSSHFFWLLFIFILCTVKSRVLTCLV